MIYSVGRILELSLAAQVDDRMQCERRRAIDGIPPSPKRYLSKLALGFTNKHPARASDALDRVARSKGLKYLGASIEYSVYHDALSDKVIKIHRDSSWVDEGTRQLIAAEKAWQRKLLTNYLGTAVIDQFVGIDWHIFGGYRTVQIRQPYLSFEPNDAPFAVNHDYVDQEHLAELIRDNPGIDASLADFVNGSRRMMDAVSLLPDTNGQNNVISQPRGNTKLIDTTPIGAKEAIAPLINSQLNSLENALKEVAIA